MLKPKQIVPLYNGARSWILAGTYKGSSIEDSSGSSESPEIDRPWDSNNGFLRRSPFNARKAGSCNDFPGNRSRHAKSFRSSATNTFSDTNAAVTGDLIPIVSHVHSGGGGGSAVEGIIGGSVPSKLVTQIYKSPSDSGASSVKQEKPSKSRLQTACATIVEEDSVLIEHVKEVGLAAAGRISEFQNPPKKKNGASHTVHRSKQPSSPAAPKQKSGPDVEKSTSLQQDESTGLDRTCPGFESRRKVSACRGSSTVQSEPSNSIELLNEGLNQMKLDSNMFCTLAAQQTTASPIYPEKYVNFVATRAEALDQQSSLSSYPNRIFMVSDDLQVRSESSSTLSGHHHSEDSRRESKQKFHSVSRQGRTQRNFHSNGKDLIEHVCNILKQAVSVVDIQVGLSGLKLPLTPYHVNEVLKRQKDSELALDFFHWSRRQEGYKHDVHTFTTMLGILGKARKFDAVVRLLEEMSREGCKPSVVTFNRLIHSYGRARQMSEALQIFHHMKYVGCIPDKVTYCTLIDLHAKAGFLEVAMDMYRQMQHAGLQPDTFTYSVMINCLGKAGELSAAHEILDEMIGKGCIPNLVTFNILIDLHAKSGKYDMALKLYNDMQETGFQPDQVTYSIVMEVLGHAGHLEEAEHIFAEMKEAGCVPDSTVYGLLVDMWGKTGNLEKACEWYKKMLESGLTPTVPTCNSLLGAFLRENLYDAGRVIIQDMKNQNLDPSLQTYTLLLSCFTLSERKEDSENLWIIMADLSHPAHTFLITLPPARLGPAHTWEHTVRFFDSICEEDQESKRSFTDAMISFLHKFNMKVEAAMVWEVAAERKIYPKAVTRKAANYWAINLHTMSMGTAIIALSRILSSLKGGMLATGIVPERIDIITGWGRRSRVTGSSLVKQAVEEILKAVSSPFRLESGNIGCFVGIGQPLVDWLYEFGALEFRLSNSVPSWLPFMPNSSFWIPSSEIALKNLEELAERIKSSQRPQKPLSAPSFIASADLRDNGVSSSKALSAIRVTDQLIEKIEGIPLDDGTKILLVDASDLESGTDEDDDDDGDDEDEEIVDLDESEDL